MDAGHVLQNETINITMAKGFFVINIMKCEKPSVIRECYNVLAAVTAPHFAVLGDTLICIAFQLNF